MEYQKDIIIDENALDIEWLEQPRMMLNYAQHATTLENKLNFTKNALEIVKAEIDKDIRSNPEKFDIVKVTETVVQNTILTQPIYQEALSEYLEIKYEYDMAKVAVRAFEQRKTALENLVKLYGAQYFAGPSAPRDITKEWEAHEKQKQSNRKVKIRRTKKTKIDE